jgi:hypothetical protein
MYSVTTIGARLGYIQVETDAFVLFVFHPLSALEEGDTELSR